VADDWDVLIDSLGNQCIAYLGRADVEKVDIWSQAAEGSAHIQITLGKDSWENRGLAVETMVEIREMFIDDLSFDYGFADGDEASQDGPSPVDRVAQFATS
jgi:hypothetical protein